MELIRTEFICVCCEKRVTHSELIHKAIVGVRVLCADCVADAALGRAVRRMPKTGSHLWHHRDNTWGFYDGTGHKKETCDEPTPEAALMAAGLMDVKK